MKKSKGRSNKSVYKPNEQNRAYLIPPGLDEQRFLDHPALKKKGKGKSDKVTYKPYEQNQMYLIPPSVDELIPQDHLVRVVSETIDVMGIEQLLRKYQAGGGTSRYHPVMMTKLFVYGYMTKVCSSRMLARATRENVMFMWLAGSQRPDFRTLNDFRGKLLKGVMEEIFVTAVKMLAAKGYIKLENYFQDGTKVESASGRYTFVWKKAVEKNDKKLDEKLRAYIRMAEQVWEDENGEYGDKDLEELGGKERFMRMKEDHLGNGQLKPAYNVQIGTENGFVVGYDLFQNLADTRTLKPHLRRQRKRLGVKPKVVITDAGYGSEENYVYLENQRTVAVVKYSTYQKEKSRKWQGDVFKTENWEYNKKERYYMCPNGRKPTFTGIEKSHTGSGYPIQIHRYECESCKYCRLKKQCTKGKGNRGVDRNERLLRLKRRAKRTLEDERYVELRKRRSVEVETVFGQIKGNQGYRRFLLRGIEKVSAEWGLLFLGYNMKQICRLNRGKTA
jgi:transposase